LFKTLRKKFQVEAFHADLEQSEREKIMSSFKNKSLKILVATDILSRGIDVEDIELVINFDTPNDPEDYVHRVGRTARAEKEGRAITFVNEKDKYKYSNIEKLIGLQIEVLNNPESVGDGPDLKAARIRPDKKKGKKNFAPGRRGNERKRSGGYHGKKADKTVSEKSSEGMVKSGVSNRFKSRKNIED
jgi:superfamily II DNA/RNA helicase